MWRWDLNPRPLEHVSSPIAAGPGLPGLVIMSSAATTKYVNPYNGYFKKCLPILPKKHYVAKPFSLTHLPRLV